MKKPTKDEIKSFGVKAAVGTIMSGQSIAAGKIVSANWKKDKKKSIAFAAGSAIINIGLLCSEDKIEKKICSLGTSKKPKAEDPKTTVASDNN
jgi:hypothetical protein